MTTLSQTIADVVRIGADRFADRPAVIGADRALTYGDLAGLVAQAGEILGRRVLPTERGRYLAVCVSSKPALCAAFYGAAANGWVPMLCSDETTPPQLSAVLQRYRPAGLVVDGPSSARLSAAIDDYPGAVLALDLRQGLTWRRESQEVAQAGARSTGPYGPDAEAVVLFTSGTTGNKKAVPITHRNLLETGFMINRFMGLDVPVRELVTVPLSHAFGLRRVVCAHLVGGAVRVEDGSFNPARVLQVLRDERCAGLSAVPAVLSLLKASFNDVFKELGPQIEFVELGSAPLTAQAKAALCGVFPKAQLCMHYGLTEASRVTFLHLFRDAHKLHTVGRPSPGVQVKLIDEEGTEVSAGGTGEIWAKGSNVAAGYLEDPELSKEKFVDGWFRTGDLARADSEGYLELLGRVDDMINVGGRKMYPAEVEQILNDAYPEIDCAVGADEHEHLGAKPVLFYSEATPVSQALFREMTVHLSRHLEPYKVPLRAVSMPAVPRTVNGKVVRRELMRLLRRETT